MRNGRIVKEDLARLSAQIQDDIICCLSEEVREEVISAICQIVVRHVQQLIDWTEE